MTLANIEHTNAVSDGDLLAQLLGGDDEIIEGLEAELEADLAAITTVGNVSTTSSEAAIPADDELEAALSKLAEENPHYAADIGTASESKVKATTKPKKAKKSDEPKAEKEPKAPRVTYVGNSAGQVLKAKLGDKTGELLLLEASDVTLSAEELSAKQEELLNLISEKPDHTGNKTGPATQQKVAEKVVMLFSWLKNGGSLNKVMELTFKVLARDGEIVTGDKGNLHAELLAKPYSVGTARAQAGQMVSMLPLLKIATKSEKGKLILNPDSLIFVKAKAELGL